MNFQDIAGLLSYLAHVHGFQIHRVNLYYSRDKATLTHYYQCVLRRDSSTKPVSKDAKLDCTLSDEDSDGPVYEVYDLEEPTHTSSQSFDGEGADLLNNSGRH